MTPEDVQSIDGAATLAELKDAFDRIFERLKQSGEPRDDEIPSLAWGLGIEIIEIEHDNVHVSFREHDALELLRERFGRDTTLTVKYGTKTTEPKYGLPMTLMRQDLCRAGNRLRFSMRIGFPFEHDISTEADFILDTIAKSHCR